MDFAAFLPYAFVLTYIGAIIYLANLVDIPQVAPPVAAYSLVDIDKQQRTTILRWMLYGLVAMNGVFGLFILQVGMLQNAASSFQELDLEVPVVDQNAAILCFIVMLVLSILAFRVITSDKTRQTIKRLVGERASFNPQSSVHVTAVVLSLLLVSFTFGTVVIADDTITISLNEILFQDVLMIVVALLGIGLAIRRTWQQSLDRLGLRLPTVGDIGWGLGVGLLLFGILIIMVRIWELFVPLEQIQEQNAAAQQIAQSFNTLPLAFILSFAAGVSEEILFRGAIQPIFGLIWTSVLFVLIHSQYTLTPATLIIFVIALGFGILRQRRNTTAAIIAHFTYNFIQLALVILSTQFGGS
jgi:membrane protease YdiL (CAAX protease family)